MRYFYADKPRHNTFTILGLAVIIVFIAGFTCGIITEYLLSVQDLEISLMEAGAELRYYKANSMQNRFRPDDGGKYISQGGD